MSRWDLSISTRPTYQELRAQHVRWLSRFQRNGGRREDEAPTDSDPFVRWTDSRVEVVREMYEAGRPLKTIAWALGPSFTSSMVGAMTSRIGLRRRQRRAP